MSSFEVTRPFDGSLLQTLPFASEEDVERALALAVRCYAQRKEWLSKLRRIEILERATTLMHTRAETLAQCIVAEGGKPLRDARVEVGRAIESARCAVRELHTAHGTEVPMDTTADSTGRLAFTYREPRGVVIAISAFNHPLNLVVHQVVPAVAAGCPVIIKPSLSTPLSCRHLVKILHEAGLPPGWCQMMLCNNDLAQRMVTDPRIAFLSFIGSAKVGWQLRSLLPPGVACALEHGGLAPIIVDETADWPAAVAPLLRGCFYHAGQVCVSGQRLYLDASIRGPFMERFVAATGQLRVGDPADPEVDVGPLISEHEVARVAAWVDDAVTAGAKLLCGGKRLSKTLYAPTVLADVPPGCTILEREIFGPVVTVESFESVESAIARANAVPEYFQAALFTRDLDRGLRLSRELHGMAVMINDHSAFRVDRMPFGGHRTSGIGVGGIGYGLKEMTIERMVVFNMAAH